MSVDPKDKTKEEQQIENDDSDDLYDEVCSYNSN